MPLPHFTRLDMTGSPGGPGTQPQEVVYLNLFEISFILPVILQEQGRDAVMLLQQATNIDLNLTEAIEVAEQRFKYSTRAFMKTPTKTHVDFNIKFNINVDDNKSMVVWNTLKAWYDLVWNSQNGTLNYKSDIIGTIIVNQHDKKGVVLRRVTFQNCQIKSIAGYGLQWSSPEILNEVQADFVADYWIDEYIDQNFTIDPGFVSGYTTT
jgi:hypothetical protein